MAGRASAAKRAKKRQPSIVEDEADASEDIENEEEDDQEEEEDELGEDEMLDSASEEESSDDDDEPPARKIGQKRTSSQAEKSPVEKKSKKSSNAAEPAPKQKAPAAKPKNVPLLLVAQPSKPAEPAPTASAAVAAAAPAVMSTAIAIHQPTRKYTNVTYAYKLKNGKNADATFAKYCYLRSQPKLAFKEDTEMRKLHDKHESTYVNTSLEQRDELVRLYAEAIHTYTDDNLRFTKEKADYVKNNPSVVEAAKAMRQISKQMNEEARKAAKEKSVPIDFALDVNKRMTALLAKLAQARAEYDEKERTILGHLNGEVMSAMSDHNQQIYQRVTREYTEKMVAAGHAKEVEEK